MTTWGKVSMVTLLIKRLKFQFLYKSNSTMFIVILLLSLLGWTRKKIRNNFIGKINWHQHQAWLLALEWQRWKTHSFTNRSKCRNGEKAECAGNSKPMYEFHNTGTESGAPAHFTLGVTRKVPRGRSARTESWRRNCSWPERKPGGWCPRARERCVQKAGTERGSCVRMNAEEWDWRCGNELQKRRGHRESNGVSLRKFLSWEGHEHQIWF